MPIIAPSDGVSSSLIKKNSSQDSSNSSSSDSESDSIP